MTAIPSAFEVVPTGPLSGSVQPPASKSVTNRLLIQAALADGTSELRNPLISDDSAAMRDVVSGLGAAVVDLGVAAGRTPGTDRRRGVELPGAQGDGVDAR